MSATTGPLRKSRSFSIARTMSFTRRGTMRSSTTPAFTTSAGFWRGEREILFAAWIVQLVMVPIYKVTSVQVGCIALIALFVVALRRARE